MLNGADYAIIGITGLSAIVSLVRGFVREALSLITWLAAIWIAFHFTGLLADVLGPYIASKAIRLACAFLILFIATLISGALLNFLIGQAVNKTGLSGTDRVLGMVFGFCRGLLLVAVILLLAKLTPMPEQTWWKESMLIDYFDPIDNWLQSFLPKGSQAQLVNKD
jgi:membrane protein required for colicin V production